MQLNTLNSHNNIAIVTYDSNGRRMPLTSGLVARWIGKCASAMQCFREETDQCLLIDMPPHWRSVVWALGAWWAGSQVSFCDNHQFRGGVYLSDSLEKLTASEHEVKVAQSLDHLALRWPGDLPWDIEDGVQVANQQPDSPPPPYLGELKDLLTEQQFDFWKIAQKKISSLPEKSLISISISNEDISQTEKTSLICAAAWSVFQQIPNQISPLPVALAYAESPKEKRQQWMQQEAIERTLIEIAPDTCAIKS